MPWLPWACASASRSATSADATQSSSPCGTTGAIWFAGFLPDTTVGLDLRLPEGTPLLIGYDVELTDGVASYRLPPAWRRECRLLVDQADGVVSCREEISGGIGVRRRLRVTGLKDATVRLLPPTIADGLTVQLDPPWPFVNGPFVVTEEESCSVGKCLVSKGVTGSLLVSW